MFIQFRVESLVFRVSLGVESEKYRVFDGDYRNDLV